MSIRVLFCGEFPRDTNVGGSPTVNAELFERLSQNPELDIVAVSPLFPGERPLYSHPKLTYLPVQYLRSRGTGDVYACVSFLRHLPEIIRKYGIPDIIHCDSNPAVALVYRSIPQVLFLHGSSREHLALTSVFFHPYAFACTLINSCLEASAIANKNVRAVFANSRTSEQLIKKHYSTTLTAHKIRSVKLGFNIDRLHISGNQVLARKKLFKALGAIDSRQSILLFVGGLSPHKGQRMLIEMLHRARTLLPASLLVLVGKDSSDLSYCMNLAKRYDLPVFFPGVCSDRDLGIFFESADIYVSAASEGFGINQVEAMAAGLPVLAMKYGAVSELFEGGLEEYCVDSQQQFITTLNRLARTSFAERRSLGERFRNHAYANYSWNTLAAELAHEYRSIAQQCHSRTTHSPR